MWNRRSALGLILTVLCFAGRTLAANSIAPIAPPYNSDRKLLASDFVRFDWTDADRNRKVPVKIYFPTESTGPFPVIVFSHGLGGTRETYEYLGRQWAANGYVVVHVQHAGSDDSVWRGKVQPMQSLRQAANAQNSISRAKDVHFVADQLEVANREEGQLKGKLDLKKLAVAGHSFGASTAMWVAGQKLGGGLLSDRVGKLDDDRFSAALAMSESIPVARDKLDELYAPIHIPTFFMTGTKDDSPIGEVKAADRRLAFDHISASPSYLLTLDGGDHMVFSGRVAARPTDPAHWKLIQQTSTAFFDSYLKQIPQAKQWLNDRGLKGAAEGIATVERK